MLQEKINYCRRIWKKLNSPTLIDIQCKMITFSKISKSFGAQEVLRDVSFQIGDGERLGIVGPNGAGKSTVFELITGGLSPDEGEVSIPRGSRIGHLHQLTDAGGSTDSVLEYGESGLPEIAEIQRRIDELERKFSENAFPENEKERMLKRLGELQTEFENLDGYSIRNRAEAALSGLGFTEEDFHRTVSELSGGWQMRAELVRVLISDPEILLLDEPSNYLDIPAIEWLQKFLRDFAGTLVLVSHDRFLLNSLTTVTLEIANARATRFAGNYDFYTVDKVRRFEQVQAAMKNQAKKKEQVERFIEKFRYKNTKASAVQSRIKMLERMDDIEAPKETISKGSIRIPEPARTGREVARLEDVGVTYDGERWVLRNIDMSIERGDKIALVGLNGWGKTTLMRVLAGRLPPSEGKRVVGHKVTEGYQSQEFAETMRESDTVYDTVRNAASGVSDQQVRSLLGGFGFSGDDIEKKVDVLSGGERVRLAFARMLVNPPNFLLLDEPTTHLDIAAREALEDALQKFTGTLCIVSHDIEFVRHVATGIIAMTPPGITRYPGGYDYYHEKMEQQAQPVEKRESGATARKVEKREKAEAVQKYSKVRRRLQKDIRRLEKRIEEFEVERDRLLEEISGEGADYAELNKQLSVVQQKINDYTSRWEAYAIELDECDQAHAERKG